MTELEIIFLVGSLAFGVALAGYARWSRARLERQDPARPAE